MDLSKVILDMGLGVVGIDTNNFQGSLGAVRRFCRGLNATILRQMYAIRGRPG